MNTEDDAPHNPFPHTHTVLLSRPGHTDSLAVQTEALQVLSALCKFYFSSSLFRCWPLLRDLYLSHLTAASLPLQQHVLKMLEELLRALSSVVAMENADAAVLRSVCEFWAELLGGPLATYIQGSSEHSSVTSQACNVLSTVGAKVMDALKVTSLMTFTDYMNHHNIMVEISLLVPYSRKYWRRLNLVIEPKIAIARILADLNLVVLYGIAIHIMCE